MNLRCKQVAEHMPDGMSRVKGNCVFTGEQHEIVVPTDGLNRWLRGERIQDAMPEVHPDTREFLISGISPKGWEQTFGKEE